MCITFLQSLLCAFPVIPPETFVEEAITVLVVLFQKVVSILGKLTVTLFLLRLYT